MSECGCLLCSCACACLYARVRARVFAGAALEEGMLACVCVCVRVCALSRMWVHGCVSARAQVTLEEFSALMTGEIGGRDPMQVHAARAARAAAGGRGARGGSCTVLHSGACMVLVNMSAP